MSEFLQKYQLTPGTPVPIDSSKSSSIAYDFINNSPYDVDIAWGLNKPFSFSIPPTTIWRGASPLTALLIPGNQWTGIIIATPSNPLGGTPPANLSAAQLTVTGYAKGAEPTEQVTTLNTQTTIGGGALSQATSVVQTGQPVSTPVVSATPNASFMAAPSLLESIINNDGTFMLGQAGTALGTQGQVISSVSPGHLGAAQFVANLGAGVPAVTFLGRAPVQLQTNNQETGYCGASFEVGSSVASAVGPTTNFKTIMTNVPSSITLNTPIENSGASSPAATDINIYGFWLAWTATTINSLSRYTNTYTTVGN